MVNCALVGERGTVGVGVGVATGAGNVMRAGAPVSVACGARARVIVCGGFERVSGAAKLQMHRFVGRRKFFSLSGCIGGREGPDRNKPNCP